MLLPKDCTIETLPADLMTAIDHALRILYWQENLIDDEMPDKWKWHLDSELETHFKVIKDKRNSGKGSSSSSEEEEWEDNAYSARFN
jgi:hypothetical protein